MSQTTPAASGGAKLPAFCEAIVTSSDAITIAFKFAIARTAVAYAHVIRLHAPVGVDARSKFAVCAALRPAELSAFVIDNLINRVSFAQVLDDVAASSGPEHMRTPISPQVWGYVLKTEPGAARLLVELFAALAGVSLPPRESTC